MPAESLLDIRPIAPLVEGAVFNTRPAGTFKHLVLAPPIDVSMTGRTGTVLLENPAAWGGDTTIKVERAPDTPRARLGSFRRDSKQYRCRDHSLEGTIPREDLEDSLFPGDEEQRKAAEVVNGVDIALEMGCRDIIFGDASPFPGTTAAGLQAIAGTSGDRFDAASGIKVRDDLHRLVEYVVSKRFRGHEPDLFACTYDVAHTLCRSLGMRGVEGSPAEGLVVAELPARISEMEQFIAARLPFVAHVAILKVFVNSSNPGDTPAWGNLWDGDNGRMLLAKNYGAAAMPKKNGVKVGNVALAQFVYTERQHREGPALAPGLNSDEMSTAFRQAWRSGVRDDPGPGSSMIRRVVDAGVYLDRLAIDPDLLYTVTELLTDPG